MERRKVGRSSKTLGILIVAGLLELTGYGPSWIAGWIGAGVGTAIAPFAIELGLAPDYTKFRVIPVDELEDQSPEILRGLEAYNRKDFELAYRIWLPIAEGGNAEAQFRVGRLFWRGEGVSEDYTDAAKWFEKGAYQKHPGAMTTLGNMHFYGTGVPTDLDYAIELFQNSRALGDPYASNFLAVAYNSGRGVEADIDKSIVLFEEAMRQGLCSPANALAHLYRNPPEGMEKDIPKAYRLALYAEDSGCGSSVLILSIEYDLSPQEKKLAKQNPIGN